MQRRQFIAAGGGLLGASGLAAAAAAVALPQTPTTVRLAGFRDLIGQDFTVYQNKRGTQATLVAVREGKSRPRQEQFSLVFATEEPLAAGVYDVENALTGQIAMYLEPAGPGRYRADFSLLV